LSQKDPKRPGSRDISELKARLGLKKGATGPAGAAKPNGAGGVVPPPGLNLPPPPGAKPPGPVIPNASDDPFGAMNAMAQYGSAARAPEIVIVNDGKPVENVGASKSAAKFAIPAAVGLGMLIFGFIIAGIGKDAKSANQGIDAAKALQKLVETDRRQLGNLRSTFENSGNLKDKKVAAELSAALEAADAELGKNKLLALKQRADSLGADLRGSVVAFYALVEEVHALIQDHQATAKYEEAATKAEEKRIAQFGVKDTDTLAKANAPFKIGIMLTNPADTETAKEPQAARVVEIGAPLCGNDISSAKPASSGACKEDENIAGFLYRYDATTNLDGATDSWSKGKVHFPGSLAPGDKFPIGEIIILQPSQVLEILGKGVEAGVASYAYYKRLTKIYDKVKQAYELGEALDGELGKKARAKKSFTFFM
jgi:hypothetical protein